MQRSERQQSRAKSSFFDDCIAAEQILTKSAARSVQSNPLPLVHCGMNTHENDTRHGVTTAEYKIAEVLIFSQKNALLDLRPSMISVSLAAGAISAR
jgi:hypothetical protein